MTNIAGIGTPFQDMRIYLPGQLRIEYDGTQPSQTLALPHLRKTLRLLAYLPHHNRSITRDHLASLFWGDVSEEQARVASAEDRAEVLRVYSGELLADWSDEWCIEAREHLRDM